MIQLIAISYSKIQTIPGILGAINIHVLILSLTVGQWAFAYRIRDLST